jgi:hypothetical protein
MSSQTQSATRLATQSLAAHDAVIRVYDEASNVIETHEQAGDFKVVGLISLAFRPKQKAADVSVPWRNSI